MGCSYVYIIISGVLAKVIYKRCALYYRSTIYNLHGLTYMQKIVLKYGSYEDLVIIHSSQRVFNLSPIKCLCCLKQLPESEDSSPERRTHSISEDSMLLYIL